MATRLTRNNQTTTFAQAVNKQSNQTTEQNQLFLNIGFQLKDGSFTKLPLVPIALDTLAERKRSVPAKALQAQEQWAVKQYLINKAIDEILLHANGLDQGDAMNLPSDLDDKSVLNGLTIEIRKRSEEAEEATTADGDIDLLSLLA